MTPGVRLRSGVVIELASGERVVCDGSAPGDVTFVSHAHADHLVGSTPDHLVCSPLTAALAATRRSGVVDPTIEPHPAIDLVPAGHVAGSRAARIEDPETGRTYLYTGDCCTTGRFYLEGFDPPSADVLVVEATYGTPDYTFPDHEEVVAEIRDWLAETMDVPVLTCGYSLGRAQKLQCIAQDSARETVYVADTVAEINEVVEAHRDVTFDVERFDSAADVGPGDAVVLPSQATRTAAVERLVDEADALTAGFSGWAVDRSYRYRGGYDATFPLSDHCDFEELVDLVTRVDPERVYTHHGSAAAFADHLTREHGYETRALVRNQSTLADF